MVTAAKPVISPITALRIRTKFLSDICRTRHARKSRKYCSDLFTIGLIAFKTVFLIQQTCEKNLLTQSFVDIFLSGKKSITKTTNKKNTDRIKA